MKKFFIFAVATVFGFAVANAQVGSLDTSYDNEQEAAFIESGKTMIDRHALHKDVTNAFVGNNPTAVPTEAARIEGIRVGVLAGVNVTGEYVSPQVGASLDYNGKKCLFGIDAMYFRGHSYKASDVQKAYAGLSVELTAGYAIAQWGKFHNKLRLTGTFGYQTCYDKQIWDGQKWQTVTETPTQIITETGTTGSDYMVKPQCVKMMLGLQYDFQARNSMWGGTIFCRGGIQHQLNAGKGIANVMCISAGVRVNILTGRGHTVNHTARNLMK